MKWVFDDGGRKSKKQTSQHLVVLLVDNLEDQQQREAKGARQIELDKVYARKVLFGALFRFLKLATCAGLMSDSLWFRFLCMCTVCLSDGN